MAANSSMIAQANASTTAFPTMSTMAAVNMTASEDGTNTTGTPNVGDNRSVCYSNSRYNQVIKC